MASGCVRVDWTKKKSIFFPGASGLVFLSLTSGLVFLTFFFRLLRQKELRCRDLRDTRSPNPRSFLSEQHGNTSVWRLEERPPFSSGSVENARAWTDRELKPPALVLGGRSGSFGLAGSGPVARARSAPGRPWDLGGRFARLRAEFFWFAKQKLPYCTGKAGAAIWRARPWRLRTGAPVHKNSPSGLGFPVNFTLRCLG